MAIFQADSVLDSLWWNPCDSSMTMAFLTEPPLYCQVLSLWTREEETKKEEEGRIVQEQGPVYGAGNWDKCDMSGTTNPLFLQLCIYFWTTIPDPSIVPTPPKTNMDTQNDGLEMATPFKYGHFWYLFFNFWGVLMPILSIIEALWFFGWLNSHVSAVWHPKRTHPQPTPSRASTD